LIVELVLHPIVAQNLQNIVTQQPHAILLVGEQGIGKGAIAESMAGQVLGLEIKALPNAPYYRYIAPDEKDTISIDVIRNLQQFLRLRTIGEGKIRRVIIIEQIERCTTEGQNAFLKTLEEPPADTLIISTSSALQNVLPTIRSRVQQLPVQTPPPQDIQAFFSQKHPQEVVRQAFALSAGLPELMHALLTDEKHPLQQAVLLAKKFLGQNTFERLLTVKTVKQRPEAIALCEALQRIATVSINQASAKKDLAGLRRWQTILEACMKAIEALEKNANTRLVLSNLCLHI